MPHQTHGALDILKCSTSVVRHAVFENDAGDANGIEPCRNFSSFFVESENAVASTGADDHGRSRLISLRSFEDGDGRHANIC